MSRAPLRALQVGRPPQTALPGVTMAEAADALAEGMRMLSGLPSIRSRCGICGGPYRPDPRSARWCGYCGGEDWRLGPGR